MTPFISLLTPRLQLRRFRDADLEALLAYRQDPRVARYQGWDSFSRSQGELLIADMKRLPFGVPGEWFQIAVADGRSDALLGDLAFHLLPDGQQAELGYTIKPQVQGQGIATEALTAFLAYCFTELRLHRVIAFTDTRNSASIAVLEKLDFRREGHFVESLWSKGEWASEYQYAMLAAEWPVQRP